MGYYFRARNKVAGDFQMGAFSWPFLLDHAGLMWPVVFKGGRWFMVTGIDDRIKGDYPEPIGATFRVTSEESRHLARVAYNLAEMNEFLRKDAKPDEFQSPDWKWIDGKGYHSDEPLFRTFRDDWTELFLKFSDWAAKSRGFVVY